MRCKCGEQAPNVDCSKGVKARYDLCVSCYRVIIPGCKHTDKQKPCPVAAKVHAHIHSSKAHDPWTDEHGNPYLYDTSLRPNREGVSAIVEGAWLTDAKTGRRYQVRAADFPLSKSYLDEHKRLVKMRELREAKAA